MLSTMRNNHKWECPIGMELIGAGFRERHPLIQVVEVKKHLDAAHPFVAVKFDHNAGALQAMSREDLLRKERDGLRLRFMKNEKAVRHWSIVYAATPEQANHLTDPNDERLCLLVGPLEQSGGFTGKFPVNCLAWIVSDVLLPGEVNFSWLRFYQGNRSSSEASSSTSRSHRAAPRRRKGKHGKHSSGCAVTTSSSYQERDEKEPPALDEGIPVGFGLLLDKSDSEPDSDCVICMDCEAAYAWDGCDHFRPLLCLGCASHSSVTRALSSCVMCRQTSRLTAYSCEIQSCPA